MAKGFTDFLRSSGVKHFRSAPYHPGLVERFNKTLKQAIKTGRDSGKTAREAITEFLLVYRVTPHSVTDIPPSEHFLGRSMKTNLDLGFGLLKPDIRNKVETQQFQQKLYHDRRSRIGQFLVGQKVRVREYKSIQSRWTKGCITEVLGSRT